MSFQLNGQNQIIILFALFLIVLSGFSLRAIDLGKPDFVDDEYLHVFAAKSMIETGQPTHPSGRIYNRALPYTKLVSYSFQLLDISEFSARLPSTIFGTLTIILIFFVGKSFFGTPVGLIAAFVTAFMPIAIAYSKECRFYSIYQFSYLMMFFSFYKFVDYDRIINNHSQIFKNKTAIFYKLLAHRKANFFWLLIFLLSAYFSWQFQRLTALFAGSLSLYLFSMITVIWLTQGVYKASKSQYFILLSACVVSAIIASLFVDVTGFLQKMTTTLPWAEGSTRSFTRYLNFLNSNRLFPLGAFFIIGIFFAFIKMHKAGFYSTICIGVPLFAHGLLASFGTPRYILDILPIYILLASYGIYSFWILISNTCAESLSTKIRKISYLKRFSINSTKYIIFFSFLAAFLPLSLWLRDAFKTTDHLMSINAHAIGGRIHKNWNLASQYLKDHKKSDDIIIASYPLAALYYYGSVDYRLNNGDFHNIEVGKIYRDFSTNVIAITNLDQLQMLISNHPRGWLIIDHNKWINTNDIPSEISAYISMNLTRHHVDVQNTMYVFSWNNFS